MKPSSPLKLLLILQCSLQLFSTSRAHFSFTVRVFSYTTTGSCDGPLDSACETFLNNFCLRGPRGTGSRSTNDRDCPLGGNHGNVYDSGTIIITSNQPWPVFPLLFFNNKTDAFLFREDFNC